MHKLSLTIVDMHCTSCAMTIDLDLEDLSGVKSAKTNYARGHTEIEFDPNQITLDQIILAIAKTGYTAVA